MSFVFFLDGEFNRQERKEIVEDPCAKKNNKKKNPQSQSIVVIQTHIDSQDIIKQRVNPEE